MSSITLKIRFLVCLIFLGMSPFTYGSSSSSFFSSLKLKSEKLSAFSDFCKAMPTNEVCQSTFESVIREGASLSTEFLSEYGFVIIGTTIVIVDAALGFPIVGGLLSVLPGPFSVLASSPAAFGLVYSLSISIMSSFGLIDPRLAKVAQIANGIYLGMGGKTVADSGSLSVHIFNSLGNWKNNFSSFFGGAAVGAASSLVTPGPVIQNIDEILYTASELEIL